MSERAELTTPAQRRKPPALESLLPQPLEHLRAQAAPRSSSRDPPASLPVYTIIAGLYREAAAVGQLIAALDALDWPPEKLDIKLVVEADDDLTRTAVEAMRLGRPYEIMIRLRLSGTICDWISSYLQAQKAVIDSIPV